MSIYISTNLYTPNELENIFLLLEKMNDKTVGVELFVEWHDEKFAEVLNEKLDWFKEYNSALHGPYYRTEHSKEIGSLDYKKSMQYFKSTLELAQQLQSKYIVYHHNNCRIEPGNRMNMVSNATRNLLELNELAKEYRVGIVVENAGVLSRGNMLFDEQQFIDMARRVDNNILIDIGHAFANGWNLDIVMRDLSDKIVAYHLHNNDGVEDSHNRIGEGKLDVDAFFESYKKYTPDADLVIEYGRHCSSDPDGIVADLNKIKEKLRY